MFVACGPSLPPLDDDINNYGDTDVKEFLEDLCTGLAVSNNLERRGVNLRVEADPGRAHIEVAISIGFLVNELVTNAI